MSYTQLTEEQRYFIMVLNQRGGTQTEIAEAIGVHKSTVCRELKRNQGANGLYYYQQAHRFALKRRKEKESHRITPEDWAYIEDRIRDDWSPEQISGHCKNENREPVSHEWIYQYLREDKAAGGSLYKHRRHPGAYKKRSSKNGRWELQNRVPIDDRPDVVDRKNRVGDWEADLMIGSHHKGALVTLVERKSKYCLIGHVKRKTAQSVKEEQVKLLGPEQDNVLTITNDNGREFALHEDVAEELDVSIYFTNPYSSWERGLSENTNGLIRQYFPKDRELDDVEQSEINQAVEKLNHRPRKTLNYRTPHEVYHETKKQHKVAVTS